MEPKERGWLSISRRMMQSEHSPCLGPTRWLIHLAAIKQPIYLMWKVALFDNSEKGKKEKARRETCKKACASAAGVSQKTSSILISEQLKKKKEKTLNHVCFSSLFFFSSAQSNALWECDRCPVHSEVVLWKQSARQNKRATHKRGASSGKCVSWQITYH